MDHLVLATRELAPTVDWVAEAIGVRPGPGGRHTGRGTRNFLLGLGPGRYLEIIGPDLEQPAPDDGRPFGIDEIDRARLTTWAARSSRLGDAVAVAARHGYDLGEIREMSRTTPDGEVLRWRLTRAPQSGVSVVPFLIDWGGTRHPSTTAPGGASLVSFSAEHPQPDRVKEVLEALGLSLDVALGPQPRLIAEVWGPAGALNLS